MSEEKVRVDTRQNNKLSADMICTMKVARLKRQENSLLSD
jgi:hypothetical protein